ncbi:hypothetical protein D9M72_572670 [compost metagenome]
MAFEHLVAKDFRQVRRQMIEIARFEQLQCPAVDLKHTNLAGAGGDPRQIFAEIGANIHHALGPPALELRFDPTEILNPHRDRRQIKNVGVGRTCHYCSISVGGERVPCKTHRL